MATLDIKFTKFDNRPWGFRLAGGSDFPEPLTVIKVAEGSLAECMGLKVGDVVVKLNDQLVHELTHGQAHEALMLAGNNFVLAVRSHDNSGYDFEQVKNRIVLYLRTEDPSKTIEGIEEKVEPYMRPIEEILFKPLDERETTPDEVPQIEDESAPVAEEVPEEEIYPEKPKDENSDPVPNPKLTEEEIAQLILDEEEVLNEKGVLGINFKKLRPRAPLLKESKVFAELQKEIDANGVPIEVQERKHRSTFLQKPERPIPKPRCNSQSEESAEPEPEPYRVVIKKQPKRSITERLVERGLIDPSRAKTPDSSNVQASEVNLNEDFNYYEETDSILSSISEFTPEEEDRNIISIENIKGIWSISISYEEETMLPINENFEDTTPIEVPAPMIIPTRTNYDEIIPPTFIPMKPMKRQRLCRRGRYAKRLLESLKSSKIKSTKGRLIKKPHYFERIMKNLLIKEKDSKSDDSLLNILMLASLACSLRETYDNEILHRGSSRRNSRRMSSRRESYTSGYENGILAFRAKHNSDNLASKYAEGRRRLSVMGMMVAEKVNHAMRNDVARGLAYAMVPCASALAFFMFNYAKKFHNNNE